jgi:hypothetical protein
MSKVLCLWLNSVFTLVEMLALQRETRGSYTQVMQAQLETFHIPCLETANLHILSEVFEKVKATEFPSLLAQFEHPPDARWVIDRAVLGFLGYTERETEAILPGLYQSLAEELRSVREIMRGVRLEEKPSAVQVQLPFPNAQ